MAPKCTPFFSLVIFICTLFYCMPQVRGQYAIPGAQHKVRDSIRVVSVTTDKVDRQLMINFNKPIRSEASLSLFNLHGMEVQHMELESNKEIVRLDLSELPEGMYVAVISGDQVNLSQYVFKEF